MLLVVHGSLCRFSWGPIRWFGLGSWFGFGLIQYLFNFSACDSDCCSCCLSLLFVGVGFLKGCCGLGVQAA